MPSFICFSNKQKNSAVKELVFAATLSNRSKKCKLKKTSPSPDKNCFQNSKKGARDGYKYQPGP